MTNPYVENLIEMGYDRADCETVAVAGLDKTFPMNIHGKVYQTQEEYDEALHDFLNGMWNIPSLSECSGAPIFFCPSSTSTQCQRPHFVTVNPGPNLMLTITQKIVMDAGKITCPPMNMKTY